MLDSSRPRPALSSGRSPDAVTAPESRAGEADDGIRILVTVTLNPNQLRSHLAPITDLDEVHSATLVADVSGADVPKLRTVVPPTWLVKVTGRAAAKLITGLVLAVRERPDWVLGYKLVPHGLNALLIGRLTRRRVLIHLIGGPAEWDGGGWRSDNAILDRLPRPVPRLERLLVRLISRADAVAVMGTSARAELIRRGLRPDQVHVVPAAVDERRLPAASELKQNYDVVTASQLIPRKRLEDFLEAVAMLRRTRPHLRAAIAGRGPLEAELKERARVLGIADAVDFLGFVPDIERVYAASRVFVLTSWREGLSIALTEAMLAGVPGVVTDVGEARDVIDPGENGYVFAVGDVRSLAEHVGRLLDDESLRRVMGQRARARAREVSRYERIVAINRRIFTAAE